MANYLDIYVKSIPIRVPMNFGVNSNVILNGIDLKDRKTKDGKISMMNFFLEFIKLDDDGKFKSRFEQGFFKFDGEKLDLVEVNFESQLNKMLNLATMLFNDEQALMDKAMEVGNKVFPDGEDIRTLADNLFEQNSKTIKSKKLDKKGRIKAATELNTKLHEFLYYMLEDFIGVDKCPKFEMLVVVDKKGYLKFPFEDKFTSIEKGELKIKQSYYDIKEASERPETPDDLGDGLDEESMDSLSDDGMIEMEDIGSMDDIIDDDLID